MTPGWKIEEVGGHEVDLYDPPDPPAFGLLYLHSYGQERLALQPAFAELVERHGLACIGPRGGRCWWLDRPCSDIPGELTAEQLVRRRVLPLFEERWRIRPRAVALLGVSVGGQGALRLAFRHPDLFPVVAAISPAIDYHEVYGEGTPLDEMYDSREQCRQDTAPMHLHPSRHPPHIFFCADPDDAWHRGCDRLHEKMAALGAAHQAELSLRGGGHSFAYFSLMAGRVFPFLLDGLREESRRLL